jgi:hypothetical protein
VISPVLILFLLALGGAAYYLFFYEEPFQVVEHESRTGRSPGRITTEIDRETEPSGDGDDELLTAEDLDGEAQVIIWLEISPPTATVLWNGMPQTARPLVVTRSDEPGVLRVSAPGYVSHKREITPDEERTVKIKLKQRKPKR